MVMLHVPSPNRIPARPVAARAAARPFAAILLALALPAHGDDRGATTAAPGKEVPQLAGEHFTLGCLFRVIIDDNDPKARQATAEAFAIAERINDACSDQMPSAQVRALCHQPHGEAHEVSPGFFEALTLARQLAEATGGRFDPTLGPLTHLWREACHHKSPPAADALAKAREACGWRHLILDPEKHTAMLEAPGMSLDFSAIARGFAADKMLEKLKELGFPRAIVHAGDDIRVGDPPRHAKAWQVSVNLRDDPGRESRIVMPLANAAVSTTGGKADSVTLGGTRYCHIIDPATGLGLTPIASATVIADTATAAAALATACCVADADTAKASLTAWGGRAARISQLKDGKRQVTVSEGFPK